MIASLLTSTLVYKARQPVWLTPSIHDKTPVSNHLQTVDYFPNMAAGAVHDQGKLCVLRVECQRP